MRDELAPALAALTSDNQSAPILGWEWAHRSDRRRTPRKYLQLAVDILMFCGTSAAALAVFWSSRPASTSSLFAASIAEAATVFVLAWQIIRYADLTGVDDAGPRRRPFTASARPVHPLETSATMLLSHAGRLAEAGRGTASGSE